MPEATARDLEKLHWQGSAFDLFKNTPHHRTSSKMESKPTLKAKQYKRGKAGGSRYCRHHFERYTTLTASVSSDSEGELESKEVKSQNESNKIVRN
jgi:hypothetical protein